MFVFSVFIFCSFGNFVSLPRHEKGLTQRRCDYIQTIFSFNAPSLRGILRKGCRRLILFIAFHISSNAFRFTFALISVQIKENELWSGKSWKLIGIPAVTGDLWVSPWERCWGRDRSLEPEAWKIILKRQLQLSHLSDMKSSQTCTDNL